MQIKLMLDNHEIPIGYGVVSELLRLLPDVDPSTATLFHELAQSKVSAIREAVARKAGISEDTVALLASDPCPEVIDSLIDNQRDKLGETALCEIIHRNWSRVNMNIAASVEAYEQADTGNLAKLLASSTDPSVRGALASNWSAPKIAVRRLLKDADPEVCRLAQSTLDRT